MRILIIGAGLAGLYKAKLLLKEGHDVVILEKTNEIGGQMRTIKYVSDNESYYFDVGPHLPPVSYKIWNDLCRRTDSPLNMALPIKVSLKLKPNLDVIFPPTLSTIRNLTLRNMLNLMKYVPSFLSSSKLKIEEKNLKDSMINLWGMKFYQDYMYPFILNFWKHEPYKMSKEYKSRVAPPKIKQIILLIKNNFILKIQQLLNSNTSNKNIIAKSTNKETLNNLYLYPKYGCQEIVDLLRDDIISKSGLIKTNCLITGLKANNNQFFVEYTSNDNSMIENFDEIIWAGSISKLIDILELNNQFNLEYRNLLTINLKINKRDLLGDKIHATYIMMQNILFHRIYEPNKMSPHMAPKNKTSICLEISLDSKNKDYSQELIDNAINQLRSLYNLKESDVKYLGSYLYEEAYPLIFVDFRKEIKQLNDEIDKLNLKISFIGRTGQYFPYNTSATLKTTLI